MSGLELCSATGSRCLDERNAASPVIWSEGFKWGEHIRGDRWHESLIIHFLHFGMVSSSDFALGDMVDLPAKLAGHLGASFSDTISARSIGPNIARAESTRSREHRHCHLRLRLPSRRGSHPVPVGRGERPVVSVPIKRSAHPPFASFDNGVHPREVGARHGLDQDAARDINAFDRIGHDVTEESGGHLVRLLNMFCRSASSSPSSISVLLCVNWLFGNMRIVEIEPRPINGARCER